MVSVRPLHNSKQSLRNLLIPIIPSLCPLCHTVTEEDESLCADCWKTLDFISDPHCAACAFPLECGEKAFLFCGACLKNLPPFSKTQATFRYTPASRTLVLQLKYGDATHLVPLFTQWMARDKSIFQGVDALIPVPLHWSRLLYRGFNQAALLARSLSKRTHIPLWTSILKRRKKTSPQGILSKEERHTSLRHAFHVEEKHRALLKGKTIMLIDDVMASGATIKFCTETLLTAGAQEVRVNVLCRS